VTVDYSVIVDAFYAAATNEFAALNSDRFWENFRVEHNGLLFRLSAHRTKDSADKGTFESLVDIGEFVSAVAGDGYPAIAANYAWAAAHALDQYRDADWDASLKQLSGTGGPEAWEEQ
jgi:hypothetical protein